MLPQPPLVIRVIHTKTPGLYEVPELRYNMFNMLLLLLSLSPSSMSLSSSSWSLSSFHHPPDDRLVLDPWPASFDRLVIYLWAPCPQKAGSENGSLLVPASFDRLVTDRWAPCPQKAGSEDAGLLVTVSFDRPVLDLWAPCPQKAGSISKVVFHQLCFI